MRRAIACVIMTGALVVAATSAGAVILRYQGKPGDVRKYAYASTTRSQAESMGHEVRSETTLTALLLNKVQGVEGEVLSLENTWTKTKMMIKTEGDDEPRNLSRADRTLLVKMDKQGHIKEFKTGDESTATTQIDAFGRVLGHMGLLPERDVKVGDSWSDDAELSGEKIGTIKLRFTRKLTALEPHQNRDCAKIDTEFGGTVDTPASVVGDLGVPGGHVEANTTLSGTVVVWLDRAAGVLTEAVGTLKMITETRWTMPAAGAGEDVEHTAKSVTITNDKLVLQK